MSTTAEDKNSSNSSLSQPPTTEEQAGTNKAASKLKEEIDNDNEEEPSFTSANFTIPIHSLLTTAQNSHGLLRHNDYSQYHSYCTRRLSRIRHTQPVRRNLTHGAKSAGASATPGSKRGAGGRHGFHSRPELTVENANQHINYILDGLYSTERAWAHAMELRAEYEELLSASSKNSSVLSGGVGGKNKKSSPGSVRQHSLKRLRKATKHVNELEGIVNKVCDEMTALEMKAYGSWMRGNWFCEIKDWKNACKEYTLALHLCQALAKTTATGIDNNTTNNKGSDVRNESKKSAKSQVTNEAEALQRSDLFTARATNVLQPLLRYCQYELQQEEGSTLTEENILTQLQQEMAKTIVSDGIEHKEEMNVFIQTKLDSIRQSQLEKEVSSSRSETKISFRDHDIVIENAQLRVFLLQIQDWMGKLEQMADNRKNKSKRESKFLELLNGFDDAISIITQDMKSFADMKSGPAVNKKRFKCNSLLGYFKHEKLKLLMERNEKMVNGLREGDREMMGVKDKNNEKETRAGSVVVPEDTDLKYKRLEEIAHLYDALLQDARAVACLPGGGDSTGEIDQTEIEDEFLMEANANILRIRALRCYYIGRMYATDTVTRYQEALALYEQASSLASEAAEEIAACQEMKQADDLIQSMIDLVKEITGAKCRADVCAYLARCGNGTSSATTSMTLLRRLDDFDSGGTSFRLADVPPSLEAIPCKPMFFDIAGNYVSDFPLDKLQQHLNEHKVPTSRGILGRWFT